MEYGSLVSEAWRLTWRFRALWVLGLFAGGAAGPSCGWSGGGQRPIPDTGPGYVPDPQMQQFTDDVSRWVVANLGLIVAIGVVLLLIGLVLFVISLVAQGAMSLASATAARGGSPRLGEAWSGGLRLFWRYLGLALVLLVVALGVAVVIAVCAAIVIAIVSVDFPGSGLIAAGFGLVGAVVGLGLLIAFGILVPFAQRVIAIEDVGPIEALSSAWSLARAHPQESFLVWLLGVALVIGVGIAVGIAAAIAAVVVGLVGFAIWAAVGWSAATIGYAVAAGLILIAALIFAGAIANTFLWHYWTLAYVRLARPAPPAASGALPGD